MKELSAFSAIEWVKLEPLAYAYKQLRNDIVLARFLARNAEGEEVFLESAKALKGKNLLLVTAFEQPLALHWLLTMAKRHVSNFSVLVFDNSLAASQRVAIRQVCEYHFAYYLGLPRNTTRHVNRHHGLAMSWIFEHIVRKLEPAIFGFIDHDLIPVRDTDPARFLDRQPCYGRLNSKGTYWNLWAGFCFFKYCEIQEVKMNFLYDFSRRLDTGGRNWEALYKELDRSGMQFASNTRRDIIDPASGAQRNVQFVDDDWIHMQGIGYNDNFNEKRVFFRRYFEAIGIATLPFLAEPHSSTAANDRQAVGLVDR